MFKRVCNILDSYCLSQIVPGYTHVSPCGNTSLIDLALTSPSQIKHCAIIPPMANSDHNVLKLEIEWKDTSSIEHTHAGELSGGMHMLILIKLMT